ncbi:o-succinylbenzoate synthase [Flavobacteriaceae bacterium]|nr:o-succinylbenzoate synthase [Flavobacteriaceae bacterium]
MVARYKKHVLDFCRPSGTSRGILKQKETWFISLSDGEKKGIGECGLLRGLSCDDRPDYEEKLAWTCANIHLGKEVLYASLMEFPSIQMGLETAFLSLYSDDPFVLYPNAFSRSEASILINGLIWMGDLDFMLAQVEEKLQQGFSCIKIKVGAIDFAQELSVLSAIRSRYTKEEMVLRVDANGAFKADAIEKLHQLAALDIHSIEQPIAAGNWQEMNRLCKETPLPIALDEELIGVFAREDKIALLESVQPQYIILKPSFIGGFTGASEWTALAKERGIDSWVTSALESNVGLNAIVQWTYQNKYKGHQGLGTGSLFTNNISSPLTIENGYITSNNKKVWSTIDQILS